MKLPDHPFPSLLHLAVPSSSSPKFRKLYFCFPVQPSSLLVPNTIIPGTVQASSKGCWAYSKCPASSFSSMPGSEGRTEKGKEHAWELLPGSYLICALFPLLPLGLRSSLPDPITSLNLQPLQKGCRHLVDPCFLGAQERGCSIPLGGYRVNRGSVSGQRGGQRAEERHGLKGPPAGSVCDMPTYHQSHLCLTHPHPSAHRT